MLRSFNDVDMDENDADSAVVRTENEDDVVIEAVEDPRGTNGAPDRVESVDAVDQEVEIQPPLHVGHHHHKPIETLMPHPSPASLKKKRRSSRVAQPPTPGESPSSSDESSDEEEEKEKERKRRQTTQEVERLLKTIAELSVADIEERLKDFQFDRRKSPEFVMAAIRSQKPGSDQAKLEVLKLLDSSGVLFTVPEDDASGDLPIHAAASADSPLLVDFCAGYTLSDPYHVINKDGNTVLHVASLYGALNVIFHLKNKLGDADFAKLVRTRNRAGLTCYDCACDRFLVPSMLKRKDESVMEFRLRSAKELVARNKRREEIQRFFLKGDQFFLPVIYYHPDCLEHLAVPTTMQKEFNQSQLEQASGERDGGESSSQQQPQPPKKRKKKQADPSEAWESPDRLKSIMAHLEPLVAEGKVRIVQDFASADRATLELAHSKEYVDFVHKLASDLTGSGDVIPFTPQVQAAIQKLEPHELKSKHMCDTGFSEGTFKAATRAAGSVCAAIDCVVNKESRRAFCVVRPPGHHAGKNGLLDESTSCGFCVFNNVMVGALYAMKTHGLKKVAIVDLDVHHGNGTEEICRELHDQLPPGSEPQVLFLSTHLHDRSPQYSEEGLYNYEFYPGTGDASDLPHNVVNVALKPLWRRKVLDATKPHWAEKFYLDHWGRQEFRRVVEERVLPPLRAFHPDIILISAGFDAAYKDLGNCRFLQKQLDGFDLQREDFFWVASEIAKVAEICCDGRLVSVLEGGYGKLCEVPKELPMSSTTTPPPTQTSTGAIAITGGTLPSVTSLTAASTTSSKPGASGSQGSSSQPSAARRGQSVTKIDRDVLARNVHGFIEGLCGGIPPPVSRQTLQVLHSASYGALDEDSDELNEMDSDNDVGGDFEDNGSLPDFLTSDEGLILNTVRRSGRVKRSRRAAAAASATDSRGGGRDQQPDKSKKKRQQVEEETTQGTLADIQRENGRKYLRMVRESNPEDYKQLAGILANLKNKTLDTHGVISAVKALFAGRPELILGFNVFLPPGYRIRDT